MSGLLPSPNVLVRHASNKAYPKMKAIDYHLVGDDGFGLNVNLMKPYSDKGIGSLSAHIQLPSLSGKTGY